MKKLTACEFPLVQSVVALCVLAGCQTAPAPDAGDTQVSQTRVCVAAALTSVDADAYNGWDGDCPGTDVDLANAKANFPRLGSAVAVSLFNKDATDYKFFAACLSAAKALEKLGGGTLDIFYSGHGGQVKDWDGDEEDGLDETLCLWNGQVVDDLVGDFLAKVDKTVQVNFWTDCCHSGSNFKAVNPIDIPKIMRSRVSRGAAPIVCKVAHLGGCRDGAYSYGSAAGGEFSIALWKVARRGITFNQLRAEMEKIMPKNQIPVAGFINMTGDEVAF